MILYISSVLCAGFSQCYARDLVRDMCGSQSVLCAALEFALRVVLASGLQRCTNNNIFKIAQIMSTHVCVHI